MIEKCITPAIAIMAVVIVFAIGLVAFNVVVDSVSGPEASASMNVCTSSGSTVFNIGGMVLVIGAIMAIIGLLFYWVSTPERFKKPNKIMQFLAQTTLYFGYGALSIVVLAIPGYLLWFLYNYTVVEGNTGGLFEVLKWAVTLVVGYFAVAGIGWISKRYFYDKLSERFKEKDYKDNVSELPGAIE